MIKKLVSLFLLFLMSFFFTSPAGAAWSDPKIISNGTGNTIMPSITTDSKGYLHSVWMELSPGSENFWTGVENPGIFYSKWNGDTWSTPLKISQNTGKWAGLPSIAVDSTNKIHVVWDESVSENEGQIMYALYNGSSWSTPVTISTVTNGTSKGNWSARIAVDSSDSLHVIYNFTDYTSNTSGPNEYYYTKYNGSWSTAEKISESFQNAQHASLATGPGTTVNVLLWADGGVWYKKNTGSGWTTSTRVSPVNNEDAQYPKMVVDGSNKIHVVWAAIIHTVEDTWLNSTRYVSSTDGGANWSSPITINTNNMVWTYWGVPLLGLTKDSKNNIYVGWGELNPVSGTDVKYRKWNGASWENAVLLRNVTEVDSPYLFQDIWDNQHFVWTEKNQGTGIWEIWYSILPAYWSTIGSGGGSLVVNPNNTTLVSLTVPSGALASSVAISAAIGPLPESANPNYVTVPKAYYFGPSGLTFTKNYTAVYTYNDAELAGGDPRYLGVYLWNGLTNSWSYESGTVNTTAKTCTVKLNHFSLYGMMTPRVKTVFLLPADVESYTVVQGNKLEVDFTMSYMTDGSPVSPPDTEIVIKGASGGIAATYLIGGSDERGLHYTGKGRYEVMIDTEKVGYGAGEYSLVARISGVEVGSAKLTIK